MPAVPYLGLKATALVVLTLALVAGTAIYVMVARGVFEPTQQLVLVTEDSEGVVTGMDLTFAGFPIGRVRRTELGADGNVRILVDVPRRDAHWLRTTSVFTLVRSLVGGTTLRAYSGVLTDPPLDDGAVRPVLRGDATAEIPQVVAAAKELVGNLVTMTASNSPLNESLASVQGLAKRLEGPGGALGVVLGNDAERQKIFTALDRTNALLARLDALAGKADSQVFGASGVMPEVRATVAELRGLLVDARASLKRVDAVLQDAQAISANAKSATADLGVLRAEVDASLRKVEALIDQVNRKWPFARDTEVKLP
ncbi:MAG TPA: mammalian cell entry protein [Caldimonas sp.]|nr:mammalian cell entry protein [Caldimonas sp.]